MRMHDLIPVLAYDEAHGVYLLKDGYVGMVFEADPLIGADASRATMLRSALQCGLPAGAFLQFHLLAFPDICDALLAYESDRVEGVGKLAKKETVEFLNRFYRRRSEFLARAVAEPVLPNSGQLLHNRILLVSLKAPVAKKPDKGDLDRFLDLSIKLQDSFRAAGLYLSVVHAERYGHLMSCLWYPDEPPKILNISESLPLDESFAQPGQTISVGFDHLRINERGYVKVMGVKTLPSSSALSLGYLMQGDYMGINNQMRCPYMITLSLYHPKQADKVASVKHKSMIATYQAFGPLMHFIPRLAAKKINSDILVAAIENGETLFEACLQVVLFGHDQELVESTAAMVETYYASLGLQMKPERRIVLPAYYNALPLAPTNDSIENLFRYSTMAASHAVALLPIVGDWKGNASKGCAMLHMSRRGQIASFDLYDSTTNYNAVIFAESGSGKSFLTQDIVTNYLSKGAKVWVIDVGRSYYKLAKVLGGEFIEFTDSSGICINPFTHIENIDDDAPMLQALIEKMAAPIDGLDDYRFSRIEEAVKSVWGALGHNASISAIAQFMNNHPDPRMQDVGAQLFSYTHQGSMGFWFDGANNVDLSRDFVVLELEELKSRRTLQQVVLMQMVSSIQREMYLSQDGRPKILVIDEAWDLLDDQMVSKFIEHAYRRFRKYGGSAIVVTQSIADLYSTPSGKAIADNSAFKIILKQNSESIERVRASKQLIASDAVFGQMQGIHTSPGKYSEFMVLNDGGYGVYRLVVDRFTQVLYSTAPHERMPIIQAIEQGKTPLEAIEDFLREHG